MVYYYSISAHTSLSKVDNCWLYIVLYTGADGELMQMTSCERGLLVHIVCKSVSAIHNIDELSISGQLTHLLRTAFTDLLESAETVAVSHVLWQPADYLACVRYFNTKLGEYTGNILTLILRSFNK